MASAGYRGSDVRSLMEMLDEKRDTIPEGEYLHMCNALGALYQTTQRGVPTQTASDIEADRRVAADLQSPRHNAPERVVHAPGVVGPTATPVERAQAARERSDQAMVQIANTIRRTMGQTGLRRLVSIISRDIIPLSPTTTTTTTPLQVVSARSLARARTTATQPTTTPTPPPSAAENRERMRTQLRKVISQMEAKLAKTNLYPNITMKRKAAALQKTYPTEFATAQDFVQRSTRFGFGTGVVEEVISRVKVVLREAPHNITDDGLKAIYKTYLEDLDREERETCRRVIAVNQLKLRQLE